MPSSTKERSKDTILQRPDLILVNERTGAESVAIPGASVAWPGRQITVSEGHRRNPRTGKYEEGGPFYTIRTESRINTRHVKLKQRLSGAEFIYDGPLMVPLPFVKVDDSTLNSFRSQDTSDLDDKGATAISLCAPTNPTSNLGTALAEAKREGLPSLPGIQSWKNRTAIAKAAGSEFLNYAFGWAPLVSDVTSVRDTARHHRDLLKQYRRDEGKNVRRQFSFPDETSTSSVDIPGQEAVAPGLSGGLGEFNGSYPVLTVETVSTTKRWFNGCFTYGGPSHSDSVKKAIGYGSDADHLYGITLTPDVLWELAPWSWAVDWFSNTGRVINNVTNFGLYGLIMRYGYIMEEHIRETTYTLNGTQIKGVDAVPSSSNITVSKVRRPANPFGFGLSWDGLSATQTAIAAAVGITRL